MHIIILLFDSVLPHFNTLISRGPNFFVSPRLILISVVLAVILSNPINFALMNYS